MSLDKDSPKTPRDELEARLTALLLGELSAEEEGTLRAVLAQDAALAQLHDRLSRTIGLVREAAGSLDQEASPPAESLKLSSDRREKLLESFKIIRPKQLTKRRTVNWREWAAVAAMLVALLAVAAILTMRSGDEPLAGESGHWNLFARFDNGRVLYERAAAIAGNGPAALDAESPAAQPHGISISRLTPPLSSGDPKPELYRSWAMLSEGISVEKEGRKKAATPTDPDGTIASYAFAYGDTAKGDQKLPATELYSVVPAAKSSSVSVSGGSAAPIPPISLFAEASFGVTPALPSPATPPPIQDDKQPAATTARHFAGIALPITDVDFFLASDDNVAKGLKPEINIGLMRNSFLGLEGADKQAQKAGGENSWGRFGGGAGGRSESQRTGIGGMSDSADYAGLSVAQSGARGGGMGGGMGGGQGRGLASGPVPSGLEAGRNSIELNRNGSSELSAALGFGEDRKALAGKALKDDVAWFEKGAQVAQPTPIPARPALGVASVNGVGYVNVDAENLGRLTVRAPAPVKTDTLADGLMAGSITDTRGVTEDRAVRSANLSRSFEGFEAIPAPAPAAASEPMLKQHLGNLSDGATTFTAGPVHDTDFGNGVRITNSPVTALDSSYKSQLLLEQDRFYIPVEALFGQRQDAKSVRDLREMGKLTREKLKEDKPAVESPESRRLNYAIALPQVLEQNLGEKPLRLGGGVINEVNYQQPAQARKPGEQFLELAKGEAGPTRIPDHREELRQKLDSIRVSDLSSDSLPLDEVIKQLDRQVLEFDPNKKGINFLVAKTPEPSAKPTLDPATGLPVTGTLDVLGDLATATIKIDPPLHELTVGQALDVISKSADRPINLSLRGSDVVLSSDKKQAEPSSVRTFTVDPRAFAQGVRSLNALDFSTTQGQGLGGGSGRGGRVTKLVTPMTNSALSVSELLRLHLVSAGVSVQTNLHGKSPPITFDDQTGDLMVRAPAQDLELIDQMIKSMNAERKINAPALVGSSPIPQPEVSTANNAFSTFSLNVSDVSFKLAAAALEKGAMPDPAAVRSEEFINAFDYRDPEPKGSAPVAFAWERARYPFAHNRDLLRFSIKTAASGRQPGRPLNLVLLLDNSGSMERSDRVRIIQECLRVLAGQLQPQDRVSVVAFARTARLWIDGLPGSQAGELGQRVGGLTPQGGTNLEEAMNLAYQTALRHFLANGINRVVLLTDGAANLGDVDPVSLKKKVEAHRQQGVALDCFGIGWEGFNDELLESLSRNGDGRYGFVNSPEAAATEFAGQLAGALQVAASDVKVQVEFNPRRVTSYRQIGYAKHQLKKEQFRDNTVDAAEIAAAEAGNALYTVEVNPSGEGPLATVRVRFKVPGTADYREHEWAVPYDGAAKALDQSTATLRLAGTASAFSEWLVSSPFSGEVTPDRLLSLLSGVPEAFAADPRPKKLEWMVRQAKSVAGK